MSSIKNYQRRFLNNYRKFQSQRKKLIYPPTPKLKTSLKDIAEKVKKEKTEQSDNLAFASP